ncbi:MAG: discoidin domain-containing protein, partial [Polyangiaceae bacterium]
MVLLGISALSLAATLPIALSSARHASANALVVAHERMSVLDALRTPTLLDVRAADPTGGEARLAIDGRDETAWVGRPGEARWRWSAAFAQPVHLGLIRAHFGASTTSGVPTSFRWEARVAAAGATTCGLTLATSDDGWVPIDGAEQSATPSGEMLAQPTRRSWFVDLHACGLRLVVDRTNAGPPVLREVRALESAEDVLRGASASDDGAYPGFAAADAVDGTYTRRWAGAPGKSRWTLRVDLPEPQRIDRVRMVLGFDATSYPRPGTGRSYAIAWGPVRYTLEVSEDGRRFFPLATEPLRADGAILPLRRRLVTLPGGRT